MSLGYIYDAHYLDHDAPEHPECAARLRAIRRAIDLDPALKNAMTWLEPYSASDSDILAVHRSSLLDSLKDITASGPSWIIDGETYVVARSLDVARLAAGGCMRAVDAVLKGETDQAFAATRPPGHHATPNRAMGFCLFNNAAIAADYARRAYGLERIAILDWDVHHGNGTQDIFIQDPNIFYLSTHAWPLWPGSGRWNEMGLDNGYGSTMNVQMPYMSGDMNFDQVFNKLLVPAIEAFKPELLIISAGYDAHINDPLGPLALSTAGYANLAGIVYNLSQRVCNGKLIGILEGGYNHNALANSVVATLRTWLQMPPNVVAHDTTHMAEPDMHEIITHMRDVHPLLTSEA